MPKRKPQDRLLKNHVQVLFSDAEFTQLKALANMSQAEGNLSRFIRTIVLQAIQPAEIVTSVSTAPVAE